MHNMCDFRCQLNIAYELRMQHKPCICAIKICLGTDSMPSIDNKLKEVLLSAGMGPNQCGNADSIWNKVIILGASCQFRPIPSRNSVDQPTAVPCVHIWLDGMQ